ncbi:putrescine/spermidine ABC transporter [Pantoea rodasii]|uniref:Putrescine/spermidine ABC transporter n=1 Tax=Pantoea rodasii TaxID=1076549 RepID=A0A0B1R1I9_9GAMM|nr:APC family permease [Pantoea rodasii]KHJ66928.1 putrescine/spermidine ABC transporter [Pantoea rodasii]
MNLNSRTKTKLSIWQVIIIGIAYMTPMTVFDTFGIVSKLTEGRVPLAYLLALAAVLFTAVSYGRMVKLYPCAGSAYTYAKNVCGNNIGFLVGWSSLLDYIFLPMINSLLAGIYLQTLLPEIPPWLSILAFTTLITYINCCNIKILANVNFLFVGMPVILMGVFVYLVVHDLSSAYGSGRVLTVTPLFNGNASILPLISGAAVLCFSFLGFDAVTTLSDETDKPESVIPKAVFYTALCGGAIFFLAAWFIQLYYPDNAMFKNPMEAMPEIVLYVGGRLFQTLFLMGILLNTVASALASHASAARLLHIMGKNNPVTAPVLGYIHPKTRNPLYCVLLTGFISLSSIFFDLDTAVSLISFGALVAFSAVNLSVIVKFAFMDKQVTGFNDLFNNVLLPLCGLACVAMMWVNLDHDAFLLGSIWAVLGISWIIYCSITQREVMISE